MTTPLIRTALAASLAFAAAPALGDDSGKELSPLEMLQAVDTDARMRADALLRQGKMAEAVEGLADSTSLDAREAAFVVKMLDFQWRKQEEIARRTQTVFGNLDAAKRGEVLTLIMARKQEDAIRLLQKETGLSADLLAPIVGTVERRLVAAGKMDVVKSGTPPEEVMAGLEPDVRARIMAFIKDRKKISAIKELRAATGLGLKDSKDVVEAVMESED